MDDDINPYKVIQGILGLIFFSLMILLYTGGIETDIGSSAFFLFIIAPILIGIYIILEHLSTKWKVKNNPEEYEDTEKSFWRSPDGGISAKGFGAMVLIVIIIIIIYAFIMSLI